MIKLTWEVKKLINLLILNNYLKNVYYYGRIKKKFYKRKCSIGNNFCKNNWEKKIFDTLN